MKWLDVDKKRLPKFSLSKRNALYSSLQHVFKDMTTPLSADEFLRISGVVVSLFPAKVDPAAVMALLTTLTTRVYKGSDKEFLIQRLAGSLEVLKSKGKVSIEENLAQSSWNLADVYDIAVAPVGNHGAYKALLRFRCICGPWAGSYPEAIITDQHAKMLAVRLGFSRFKRGTVPRKLPSDLFGLQLLLFVTGQEDKDPRVEAASITPSLRAKNRSLIKDRDKACNKFNKPCVYCPMGADKCPQACRRTTLFRRECPVCNTPFYSPSETAKLCKKCYQAETTANEAGGDK